MTRIWYERINNKHRLHVSGHADYAEKGKDIVCAAVSTLSCTLAKEVEDVPGIKSHVSVQDGAVYISATANTVTAETQLEFAFRFAMTGFAMIAEEYSENVAIVPSTE